VIRLFYWLYLRLLLGRIAPCLLPNKKADFLMGGRGLKVLRVLAEALELHTLSLVLLPPAAVEFTEDTRLLDWESCF
jgi:hypothetical protein